MGESDGCPGGYRDGIYGLLHGSYYSTTYQDGLLWLTLLIGWTLASRLNDTNITFRISV
jgi:hypothetical protein